jgi:sulfite oxidase
VSKDPSLEVLSSEPFNAQPPLGRLTDDVTPTELFYVHTHAPIPHVDVEEYRLTVGGMVERPLRLTLADLEANFPIVESTVTLQSAGNRRDELARVRAVPDATPWGASAIGTATWRGIQLAALLDGVGPLDGAAHVAFQGLDQVEHDGQRSGYGGSIPLAKARSGDVLLAWEMNGAPLLPEHGYPLRVIVPGWIGARSVKWLASIQLRNDPSDSFYQQRANRIYPADVETPPADPSTGMALGELSLSSAICDPLDGAELGAGPVTLRGWALAGGQRTVERVEVSADHGAHWTVATLTESLPGAWRRWEAKLDLPAGPHQLVCRAWDSAAMTQPEDAAHLWNVGGYMNNAWHRVRVWVVDSAAPAQYVTGDAAPAP